MNRIVSTEYKTYIPQFCENTDTYYDKSPYKPYEKNRISYKCRCKAGVVFTNNHQFKQHIKSNTHITYIRDYKDNFKELDEQGERLKELKIENGKLKNRIIHLERYKHENEKEKKRQELIKIKIQTERYLQELDEDDSEDDTAFQDCQ